MAPIILNPAGASEWVLHDSTRGAVVSASSLAQQNYDNHMDWGGGGAWFMFSMMAIFWLGVIVLGWWAIASYNRRNESARQSPLDVTKHRYARGEITSEEFERLKHDLG